MAAAICDVDWLDSVEEVDEDEESELGDDGAFGSDLLLVDDTGLGDGDSNSSVIELILIFQFFLKCPLVILLVST